MMKVCVRVFECVECNHNLRVSRIQIIYLVYIYFVLYILLHIFSFLYLIYLLRLLRTQKKNSSLFLHTHTVRVYLLYVDLKTLFESYFSSTKHKECSFPNATCTTFFNPSTFTGVTRYAALLSN